MLELLLKLRVLTAQAAMVGMITESYWYGSWMMNVHRELEWYYNSLGMTLEREVDLDATIKLSFKLDKLEAEILATFDALMSTMHNEAQALMKTNLPAFKAMLDVVCYLDRNKKDVEQKLKEREFEPEEAPVAY